MNTAPLYPPDRKRNADRPDLNRDLQVCRSGSQRLGNRTVKLPEHRRAGHSKDCG